jgi:ABC-type branched-subunit amino acid transport system substrate-binding protein
MCTKARPSWSSALAAALVVAGCGDVGTTARVEAPPSPAPVVREMEARPVIGVVPSSDPKVTAALVAGAKRALDEARAGGGPDLTLVVGAASSQWSSVAAEAARLACDERVVALVAPPERELAHPAAQAATRCGVPLVSTSAAASVTAAGSRYVFAVVTAGDSPADPATAGYDAARVVVEAVRRGGLLRESVRAAAADGTPVAVAAGAIRFDPLGRRESASN